MQESERVSIDHLFRVWHKQPFSTTDNIITNSNALSLTNTCLNINNISCALESAVTNKDVKLTVVNNDPSSNCEPGSTVISNDTGFTVISDNTESGAITDDTKSTVVNNDPSSNCAPGSTVISNDTGFTVISDDTDLPLLLMVLNLRLLEMVLQALMHPRTPVIATMQNLLLTLKAM